MHHIAFACDDIFAEVARAKEAGVPLLEIPLNYYDDLAARFDFDDEFLSELAYYNVLYDRDAQGGELFHVYTEPFEGRFFFEVLQRKGDYAGYGAANVAVRLAALAKARSGQGANRSCDDSGLRCFDKGPPDRRAPNLTTRPTPRFPASSRSRIIPH